MRKVLFVSFWLSFLPTSLYAYVDPDVSIRFVCKDPSRTHLEFEKLQFQWRLVGNLTKFRFQVAPLRMAKLFQKAREITRTNCLQIQSKVSSSAEVQFDIEQSWTGHEFSFFRAVLSESLNTQKLDLFFSDGWSTDHWECVLDPHPLWDYFNSYTVSVMREKPPGTVDPSLLHLPTVPVVKAPYEREKRLETQASLQRMKKNMFEFRYGEETVVPPVRWEERDDGIRVKLDLLRPRMRQKLKEYLIRHRVLYYLERKKLDLIVSEEESLKKVKELKWFAQ
jgi:hypothetical protein